MLAVREPEHHATRAEPSIEHLHGALEARAKIAVRGELAPDFGEREELIGCWALAHLGARIQRVRGDTHLSPRGSASQSCGDVSRDDR